MLIRILFSTLQRFRLLLALGLSGLCACATDSVSRAEVEDLRHELRASRERESRLERRMELLEASAVVGGSTAVLGPVKPHPSANAGSPLDMPSLTVVKLKPKVEPAPKLDTRVLISEPSPELLSQLANAAEDARADAAAESESEDPAILEASYNADVRSIRTGDVEGGADRLEKFADAHPKHPDADNALYYAGVARMGLGDFSAAASRFERVERDYPAGDVVADAMLKLAECRAKLNRPADARALYSQVAKTFPGTPAASQAQARLAAYGARP